MSEPTELMAPARRGSITLRAFAVLTVLVVLVLTLAVPIRSWMAQQAAIESLSGEVAKSEQEVADLESLRARWDDPAYVAAQARERLHFVLPGEIGYTVIGADTAQDGSAGAAVESQEQGPWFEVLWQATRTADQGSSTTK